MNIPAALVEILRWSERIMVLTGAGISAESGVPTFRDAQTGLWARFKPEELATPEAFRLNPRLVWDWYAERRAKVRLVAPNPGHYALAAMEKLAPDFHLATQNVDGLHQRAGSRRVWELHGNLTRVKCFEDDGPFENWNETGPLPPRCPRCGGALRPDVVWFGESLPESALRAAEAASQKCEVFFSIGTSAMVYPAAGLAHTAKESGATLVEINTQETPLTRQADFFLGGPAGQFLPELVRAVWPKAQI